MKKSRMRQAFRKVIAHLRQYKYWYLIALVLLLCYHAVKTIGAHEAGKLECNHISVPAEVLPGAEGLRIALISDIHNNPGQLEKIVAFLQQQRPDIIVFVGDIVTAYERFMRTRWAINGFRGLVAIAPTYAVFGNHDYEKQEQVERVYNTAGIRLLRNEAVDFPTPSGTTLRLVGLGDWNEGDEVPEQCLSPKGKENKPVLLLSHDPESRWLLRNYDWDLMLSGHNHGGQIGIPFTDNYLSFRSSMPAGLFNFEDGRHVFVTRGVGSILNMRFFCPPEINIISIKR